MRLGRLILHVALAAVWLGLPEAGTASEAPATYVGRPLAEALEGLRADGLRLVYGNNVVTP